MLTDEENDPDAEAYVSDDTIIEWLCESEADYTRELYEDTKYLVDLMNEHLKVVSPLRDWLFYPYVFELETAYNDNSFRIEINSEYFADDSDYECVYDASKDWNDIPNGMTFAQFVNVCDKMQEYAQYMLCELAKYTNLNGIAGGYCGGRYMLPDNTPEEDTRFGKVFAEFLEDVRASKHIFTAWSF